MKQSLAKRMFGSDKCFYLFSFVTFVILWVSSIFLFVMMKLNPEIGMVAHSQCENPLRGWDGKVMNIKIWITGYDSYPSNFYVHDNVYNGSFDRRRLTRSHTHTALSKNYTSNLRHYYERSSSKDEKNFVILWGTHHKTGTYLAQKVFALICSRQRWCCVFQPTRASIHAIKDALLSENVHVLGHSQWVWHPNELGVPYKFVHFYRHPFKKIVSGFRYHREGAEAWTKRTYLYNNTCAYPALKASSPPRVSASQWSPSHASSYPFDMVSSQYGDNNKRSSLSVSENISSSDSSSSSLSHSDSSIHKNSRREKHSGSSSRHNLSYSNRSTERRHKDKGTNQPIGPQAASAGTDTALPITSYVTRAAVVEYCRHTRLCQTCCRREHETHGSLSELLDSSTVIGETDLDNERTYSARSDSEYEFVCGSLGTIAGATSLSSSHNMHSVEEGLVVEGGLQYFENLRMARIFNATFHDPDSIQIDIDDLIQDYSSAMRRILRHVGITSTQPNYYGILGSLKFFDIKTSFVYKWNMASQNHIDHTRPRYQLELMDMLNSNKKLQEAYRPIIEMLQGNLGADKQKEKQAFSLAL